MATSQPTEDITITTCPICLEEFKTPKCLPCLHNFCESCLNSYIISTSKSESKSKVGKTQFHCPVCREVVTPPDLTVKYQEWAQQFPSNHLLVSLMDQNKLKAKVKLCDPCKEIDDAPAISWCLDCNEALCKVCTSVHKRQKMSKDHNLQNIDEMQTMPLVTSLPPCENHKGKSVEAFCRDHNQPCCATCVAIKHRKCDHVATLDEAASGILKSKDLSNLLLRLKDTSALTQTLIKEKRESIKTLNDEKGDIQNEIQKTRRRMIDNFDKQHVTFLQKFTQKHNNKTQELSDSINDLEHRDKVIQNCTNLIETCMTRSSEAQVFLEMKKTIEREEQQVKALEQIQAKHRRVKYDFKMDGNLNKMVNGFTTIGEVDIVESSDTLTGSYPRAVDRKNLKECLPTLVSELSLKEKCGVVSNVHGMCFMPNKELLLPLYNGKKLAVLTKNGDLVKQTKVPSWMFDVCMLDSYTAVSTHGGCNTTLSFINTQTLKVNKTINVGGDGCYGITYSDNKLYIGAENKILILDSHGNKKNEISINGAVYGITTIKQGQKKIVYTNYSTNSCHFLRYSDLQEIHIFRHHQLSLPRGVTSDREGNVYIAECSSKNVLLVSSEGILIRILLTNLDGPTGILFDDSSDVLFVSYAYPAKLNIYNMIKQ